jgi:hypothetical protein
MIGILNCNRNVVTLSPAEAACGNTLELAGQSH